MSVSIIDISTAVVTLLNGSPARAYLDGRGFTDDVYDFSAQLVYQPRWNTQTDFGALKMPVIPQASTTTFDRSTHTIEEKLIVAVMKDLPAPVSPSNSIDAGPWVKFTEALRDYLKQTANRTYTINGSKVHLRQIETNQLWVPEYLKSDSLFSSALTLTLFHLELP